LKKASHFQWAKAVKAVVIREVETIGMAIADASQAPFVPQRLVATMDRTLRICYRLTSALEAAYAGVPKLGKVRGWKT